MQWKLFYSDDFNKDSNTIKPYECQLMLQFCYGQELDYLQTSSTASTAFMVLV